MILSRLSKLRETIATRLRTEGVIHYGTTDFFRYSDNEEGYGAEATDGPTLNQKYFFGQDEWFGPQLVSFLDFLNIIVVSHMMSLLALPRRLDIQITMEEFYEIK